MDLGGQSETLTSIALRAFRSPQSGIATLLAGVAADVGADLVALYLVPHAEVAAELLAAGGRDATALGPPGKAGPAIATAARAAADHPMAAPSKAFFAEVTPWAEYDHVLTLPILLDRDASCVVVAATRAPEGMRAESFYRASAPAGILVQMIVTQRDADGLRQELRHLHQERSLHAASLQHDLRGPLAAILGSARTLEARADALDREMTNALLRSITEQVERMNRMLGDMLEKHVAAPDGPVRQLCTEIKPLAERVAAAAARSRAGTVVVECREERAVTDPDRLERALLNLVDNALKYSPEAVPVHMIVEEEGSHLNITVADNGPGVAHEVLPGLFGAYNTDPARSDGTGLGLHSVRELAQELGGRVGYSRHSGWTRFMITIPLGTVEDC